MIPINAIDGSTGAVVALNTLDGSVVEPLLQALAQHPLLATNNFAAPVISFVAKAAPGNLLAVHCTNANAALRYLQIFNNVTNISAGSMPTYSFPLPAGSATVPGVLEKTESFFGAGGAVFAGGIVVGVSTTLGTFTPATAADHVVHVHYV